MNCMGKVRVETKIPVMTLTGEARENPNHTLPASPAIESHSSSLIPT
jgi:hypothetical protein